MSLRSQFRRLGFFLLLWSLLGPVRAGEPTKKVRDGTVAWGAAIFKKYCVLCHGDKGEGDGIAAKNHNPRPANLTRSELSDAQKEAIIRNGGGSVGRSEAMPPWRQELSDRQIKDLIGFLRTIKTAKQ
jgi:mono/diheme cytochrome c family protein